MKSVINGKLTRPIMGLVVLTLGMTMFTAPIMAQVVVTRPGPGPHHYGNGYRYGYGPPPPHMHRGPSDFDKALAVVGTVGAVAAIANAARYNYGYGYDYHYHYRQPTVIVTPPRPAVVVRSEPSPIIVEKQVIVEKPVVVERQVPMPVLARDASYSPKLGASFRIENMQIPGYQFTAARLMSDPTEGSPLHGLGLRKGDVITRLDDSPADTLAELERHNKNTLVRYIKTGTTKVLLGTVFIPADTAVSNSEIYNAP